MSIELIKSIKLVPKRNAFKARSYNNVGLKKWVDFGSVQEHFNYSLCRHNLSFVSQGELNLSYTKYAAMANTITANIAFFINYFPNLILQAVLTQPENDSPSFLACWLICSSRSSSKRICFIVLFERSKSFFSCIGSYHYIRNYLKKAIPRSTDPTLRDLTTITLTEVMIMANHYDSAHLRARQSKLYKFYDLSTAQVIQTTATTERQARKNLGKQSLIFIARIRITPIIERARTWGGYNHE